MLIKILFIYLFIYYCSIEHIQSRKMGKASKKAPEKVVTKKAPEKTSKEIALEKALKQDLEPAKEEVPALEPLCIESKCLWSVYCDKFDETNPFYHKVNAVCYLLKRYIKVMDKVCPRLARLMIEVCILCRDDGIVVELKFDTTTYDTIKIITNQSGGKPYIYFKSRTFSVEGEKVPLSDWIADLITVGLCITKDIKKLF